MAHAAELVSDPSLAIKRIALVSGYSDVSNFYRDFKQAHGMSPRKLRVRHLRLLSEESLRGGYTSRYNDLNLTPSSASGFRPPPFVPQQIEF